MLGEMAMAWVALTGMRDGDEEGHNQYVQERIDQAAERHHEDREWCESEKLPGKGGEDRPHAVSGFSLSQAARRERRLGASGARCAAPSRAYAARSRQ